MHAEQDLLPIEGIEFCGCSHYSMGTKESVLLRGRELNDELILDDIRYKIITITSRIVKIVQYCIALFTENCPNSEHLGRVSYSEGDPISPLIPLLSEGAERGKFLLSQYNFASGIGLPIYSLADKDYNRYVDAVAFLISTNDQILYSGDIITIKDSSNTTYTLTFSTLLMLNNLNILAEFIKIKEKLFIPKSLQKVVEEYYDFTQKYMKVTSNNR